METPVETKDQTVENVAVQDISSAQDISQEDRQALAEAALHGDVQTLRAVIARVVGKMTSPRKAASSRENGKKGGRPRKDKAKVNVRN